MRTRLMRGKFTLLFMVLGLLLAVPAIALAQDSTVSTSAAPTIQSDLPDYAPGDTVTLTGSGWQPAEVVHIFVNDDIGQTWGRNVDVTADQSGNITDQFQLPSTFVAVYKVTATGATSGTATTTFTDGNVSFRKGNKLPQDYRANYTIHSPTGQQTTNTNCSGSGTAGSLDVLNNSTNNNATVDTNKSLKLGTVTAPSGTAWPAGVAFDYWSTDAAGDNPVTNLCIVGSINSTTLFAQFKDTSPVDTTITSQPADPTNSTSASFSFTSNHTGSSVSFECSLDGSAFSACTSPKSYTGLTNGPHTFEVRAKDGTVVDQTPASYTWTVDTAAPTVSSVVPDVDATNVAVGDSVTATFSEAMNASTISGTTFTLKLPNGNTVPATVSYDAATKTAKLDPISNLANSTTYTATVTTGVKDLAGNALATAKTWKFTTASACTAPSITTQPTGQSITYGADANFSVAVSGTSPSVQWQKNTGGTTWTNVSTGTSLTVTKPPVSDSGNKYRAVVSNSCGSVTSNEVTLTVNQATATVTLSNLTHTYDGTAKAASATTTPVGLNVKFAYSQGGNPVTNPTNAGSYDVVATVDDPNYQGSKSGILTINKADATIDVKGYTGVYDGNSHGATGTAKGVNNEDLSNLLNLGNSFTNVPGGTANWSFNGGTNYKDASGTANISITKADATIKVDGYTGTYDGNDHGATGSATGVKGEDLGNLLDLGSKFTNVPGGTASWSFAGNGNYSAKSGTANISITKADATINVNGYTGTYDGNAHGATGTAKGVDGAELPSSLLHLGASYTNVPGGTANWSFDGNTNYEAANGSVDIVINKAKATIDVKGY